MSAPGLDIVVVDDEERQRSIVGEILRDEGHRTEELASGEAALERVRRRPPDLVLTDLRMTGVDGHELLRIVRREHPDVLVILMTAFATIGSAVEAMKDGAFDYLQKPFARDELVERVRRVAERRALERENRALKRRLVEAGGEMLGDSEAMRELRNRLDRVAAAGADVLLVGESGTGKELAARRVHHAGPAATGPFVAVNCAAIPESLAESELFGHVKGAFTGAEGPRAGRFEQAHGGTLFLDEVGSMSPALQAKLLRVLEDRTVERVGGAEPRRVDVRVIAATNRGLRELCAEGRFREDLYHRLNVVEIVLPPLRERTEDALLLAERFRDLAADRLGVDPPEIGDDLREFLASYRFPGNVRELGNLLERMVVLSEGDPLGVGDLPPGLAGETKGARGAQPSGAAGGGPASGGAGGVAAEVAGGGDPERLLADGPISLPDVERRLLAEAIRLSSGNLSEAAKRLGLSYKTMQYRARKFGLG